MYVCPLLSYLQWAQYGAGGVHEEESQVTENVGEGKQPFSHKDGMESVPVLPLKFHILELWNKQTHSETLYCTESAIILPRILGMFCDFLLVGLLNNTMKFSGLVFDATFGSYGMD